MKTTLSWQNVLYQVGVLDAGQANVKVCVTNRHMQSECGKSSLGTGVILEVLDELAFVLWPFSIVIRAGSARVASRWVFGGNLWFTSGPFARSAA